MITHVKKGELMRCIVANNNITYGKLYESLTTAENMDTDDLIDVCDDNGHKGGFFAYRFEAVDQLTDPTTTKDFNFKIIFK